ncbi:MAG: hypothetical protein CME69_03880 [Halobacteriovorax sp.]|nr:hypothetical protein [Halobacteriovorax sp.]
MNRFLFSLFLLSSSVFADQAMYDEAINFSNDILMVGCKEYMDITVERAKQSLVEDDITKEHIQDIEKMLGGNLESYRRKYLEELSKYMKQKDELFTTKLLERCLETKCEDNKALETVLSQLQQEDLVGLSDDGDFSYDLLVSGIVDNIGIHNFSILGSDEVKNDLIEKNKYENTDRRLRGLDELRAEMFKLDLSIIAGNYRRNYTKSNYKKMLKEASDLVKESGRTFSSTDFNTMVKNSIDSTVISVERNGKEYTYNILTGRVTEVVSDFNIFNVEDNYDVQLTQSYVRRFAPESEAKEICVDSFYNYRDESYYTIGIGMVEIGSITRKGSENEFTTFLGLGLDDNVITSPRREKAQDISSAIYEPLLRQSRNK